MGGGPVYERLANRLRDEILASKAAPGSFIGTEVELSKRHMLARMTVRRAVQSLVDEGLLERRAGRGVFVRSSAHETRKITMLAGNLCWEPAVLVSRGVRETAAKFGVEVILRDARGNMDEDVEAVRSLPMSGTKGAVIMSQHCAKFNSALCSLVSDGFPFVLVDQTLYDIDAPSVCSDNIAGGTVAASKLAERGHERIVFIGDVDAGTSRDRFNGVRAFAEKAGLPEVRLYDISGRGRFESWAEPVTEAVADIMRFGRACRPTAVVCSCDAVARECYRAFSAMGASVPDDVSVVGFDDDPIAEWLSPPLSTVRQNFTEMGRLAMKALLGCMSSPYSGRAERHIVPVDFIERESIKTIKRRQPDEKDGEQGRRGAVCGGTDVSHG